MEHILTWLSTGSPAAQIVLAGSLLLIASIVAMLFIAVVQGREVQLWPPRIGPQIKASAPDSSPRFLASCPGPELQGRELGQRADLRGASPKTRVALEGFAYPADKLHPSLVAPEFSHDMRDLFCTEILHTTPHSVIQKCSMRGRNYILKRTYRELCDLDAISRVISKRSQEFSAPIKDSRVTIAVPGAVWIDDYVWELLPYYSGLTLDRLLASNSYALSGALLGELYEGLRKALYAMHQLGVVHRDVCPGNILLAADGTAVLLDPSFIARTDEQQVAVGTHGFASPEQLEKKAVVQSDFFSIAATALFLGTAREPRAEDPDAVHEMASGLRFGPFTSRFYRDIPDLLCSMLAPKVSDRPSASHLAALSSTTVVGEPYFQVLGIIDASPFGYYVMQKPEFRRFATDGEAREYLRAALAYGAVSDARIRDDVERFLAGENPWLRRV